MRLINFSLILFFVALYQVDSFAQVVVHTEGKVTDLLEKHATINKNHSAKLIGFCVQICFESGNDSRERAENIRRTFLSKYPKTSAYLSFKEPNFRVKVGDFRTRAEARGFRKEILADFPQAFVLKDEIKYPKHIFEIIE
ncbi:MAG: SPOR domain-containing protein [Bacteroidales bacterium]|jgi:hypothetical protein|nr:SPOR domain-containing protein [Bacteroidales bacterium]